MYTCNDLTKRISAMIEIQSKKTKLKQQVTAETLAVMQEHSGKDAFRILKQDATPPEAKEPAAKKKSAEATN